MVSLPIYQVTDRSVSLLQTNWKSEIDPVLNNPANQSILIINLSLQTGVNVFNHQLGRVPKGWIVVDSSGVASIFRSAPMNNLTMTLTSSAVVLVSLEIF